MPDRSDVQDGSGHTRGGWKLITNAWMLPTSFRWDDDHWHHAQWMASLDVELLMSEFAAG